MQPINLIFDKKFRQKLRLNPSEYAKQIGINVTDDVQFVIKTNGSNVIYMPFAPTSIVTKDIEQINAAGLAGTAGTVGSAGTVSSAFTSLATAGTASSVGSLGSIA